MVQPTVFFHRSRLSAHYRRYQAYINQAGALSRAADTYAHMRKAESWSRAADCLTHEAQQEVSE